MVTSACRSIEPHAELSLERTGDFGHLEDFELIVNLNVIVTLETQTAFAAGLNFAHIVLEVLQAGEFAGPDHHVVAQEASAGIAAYHAFENTAAGNEPNLGHADNLISRRPNAVSFFSGESMPLMAARTSSTAS